METVSKKRGRPRKYDPAVMSVIGGLWNDVRSNRQRQALCHVVTAQDCLSVDGKIIEGVENIVRSDSTVFRTSILEHLGRLKADLDVDDEWIVAIARNLSREFATDPTMTVRRAVESLRAIRHNWDGFIEALQDSQECKPLHPS